MKETDLYLPLKAFLETQHYEVKGEILNCDVVAVREKEEPVIVELKLTLNLSVILQAVERLTLTQKVYIGVPDNCKTLKKKRKHIVKVLRMLGLGLLVINPDQSKAVVQVLIDPEAYKPRKSKNRQGRLLGEFEKLIGDPNLGGQEKRMGAMTVYRQKALEISQFLKENGPTKASVISQTLDNPKARGILYRNVYGWFERVSTGIYALSPRGSKEAPLWKKRSTFMEEKIIIHQRSKHKISPVI